MKTLFLRLAMIMLVTLIGFQLVFGVILPRYVLHSRDSYLTRWRHLYTEPENADLVCLGSSRIQRHCNPEIISRITHLRTDVIAEPASMIGTFEKFYKDWLKRNPRPKTLVVGIDITGIGPQEYLPFPEYFYPVMTAGDEVYHSPEYTYTRYTKALGYFYYKEIYLDMLENPEMQPHTNGFLPRNDNWVDTAWDHIVSLHPGGFRFAIYQPTIERIFRLMKEETNAGVACIGVISPEYAGAWEHEANRDSALKAIKATAVRYGIKVLNFDDSSYKPCSNKSYFFNSQHLNTAGSAVFSRDLADSIIAWQPQLAR
jgi:hypothetical protein